MGQITHPFQNARSAPFPIGEKGKREAGPVCTEMHRNGRSGKRGVACLLAFTGARLRLNRNHAKRERGKP